MFLQDLSITYVNKICLERYDQIEMNVISFGRSLTLKFCDIIVFQFEHAEEKPYFSDDGFDVIELAHETRQLKREELNNFALSHGHDETTKCHIVRIEDGTVFLKILAKDIKILDQRNEMANNKEG